MKHKLEALVVFIHFKKLVENKLDRKIKSLQSDGGGEFRNFSKIALESGIELRHSCPYSSVQNGRAK